MKIYELLNREITHENGMYDRCYFSLLFTSLVSSITGFVLDQSINSNLSDYFFGAGFVLGISAVSLPISEIWSELRHTLKDLENRLGDIR